jgi:glyoxylase-like metal-dependent hydrolase (beta-lactamase superfamily II)
MTIEIKMLTLGIASTNCYIIGDSETNEAILIDPVDDAPLLLKSAEDAGWTIKLILGTHAHFDHILASKELKKLTSAPFYVHEECVDWLEKLSGQGAIFGLPPFPEAAQPDRLLTSVTETLQLGSIKLETLYTPGHSPGHLSFFMREQNIVFSGDCLFAGSIGRVDLPGADYETLMRSIFNQLVPLGDEIRVLPGHMQDTTIGRERATNPFLLDYANR